mgnify:CR=1 FL=1
MRILMVHSFHHARGGDTTYTRALTRGLQARGHEVSPLATRHPDNEPATWEVRFPRWIDLHRQRRSGDRLAVAASCVWSPEAALSARGLARDLAPEVVHVQHLHRHLTPSILPPLRRTGAAVLWTLHDYELVCPSGLLFTQGAPCERCLGHRYSEAVRHRCKWGELLPSVAVAVEKSVHHLAGIWRLVDRFLCPSKALADTMVRFGVPHDRIEHLPNFVEAPPGPEPLTPGAGWLVAGRLTEEKGVHIAIEAARQLPEHPLWICGDGPWRGRLEQKARGMPWVRFLGHRPQEEIASLLGEVRLAAVPSIWPENFPYAVTEAQAAGRPVVASAIGGMPEMIDHEVDGLLVPPGQAQALAEAVRGLLQEPGRASRLGQAGQRRVRERLAPLSHLQAVEAHYFQVRALRASRR